MGADDSGGACGYTADHPHILECDTAVSKCHKRKRELQKEEDADLMG